MTFTEFLMSYGIAFVVIGIAMYALMVYGVPWIMDAFAEVHAIEHKEDPYLQEMLADKGFSRWADEYGLSFMERDAAWSAWNRSKETL